MKSYLSVPLHPALGRVLGQEVEPEAGQGLAGVAVLPKQLEFADADQIRIFPDFHEEKLAQRENSVPVRLLAVELDRFVEGVRGVMAAGRTHELFVIKIYFIIMINARVVRYINI